MAGGASSRLWPASGLNRPKWGLRLFGEQNLLQQAWQRARAVAAAGDCFVVTGVAQAALVRRSLPQLRPANLLIEPDPRDTSGAIALAAGAISRRSRGGAETQRKKGRKGNSAAQALGDGVMLVLPGDHIIDPVERFAECVLAGARAAEGTGALVTLGIVPRRPSSGYGYLHRGAELTPANAENGHPRVYRVLGFREKPDAETAQRYVSSGEYYWNGGIFLWTLTALLAELERQLPAHAAAVRELSCHQIGGRRTWPLKARSVFLGLRKVSIDFGIMEHAQQVAAVAADFAWDDIGSWSAVAAHLETQSGNTAAPASEVIAVDAACNLVFAPGRRVALVGVNGLAVIEGEDGILVCRLDRDQEVKKVSELARDQGRSQPK
jgi:mannose-1-phosphate guanylyltransferase